MKFSEKKLDKMLPGSRPWQDQADRVVYGAPKQKEAIEFFGELKHEQAERRTRRDVWMHNSGMR